MSSDPLEALKTPLGAFEPNVLLAGLEGVLAAWLGFAAIWDRSPIPEALGDPWHWSLAVWTLLLLVVIVLVGLIVEGMAGALERLITWTSFNSHELRQRFAKLFGEPDPAAWRDAQRWIWTSHQASGEFARRRLRLLAARNTTFVVLSSALALPIGLLFSQPDGWAPKAAVIFGVGIVMTALFCWVWIAAQQGYNRAVQDALRAGPP